MATGQVWRMILIWFNWLIGIIAIIENILVCHCFFMIIYNIFYCPLSKFPFATSHMNCGYKIIKLHINLMNRKINRQNGKRINNKSAIYFPWHMALMMHSPRCRTLHYTSSNEIISNNMKNSTKKQCMVGLAQSLWLHFI